MLIYKTFSQRFGLFSQPTGIAIGETNKYPRTKPKRDPEASGEVITEPINYYAGHLKRGPGSKMTDPSFPNLARNDKYKNPKKGGLREFEPMTFKHGGHE